MDIDTLYPLVTEAIRQAEALEDLNAPAAAAVFAVVSHLEEEIAAIVPPSDYQGVVARVGAVNAAIKSNNPRRACDLALLFVSDQRVGLDLAAELNQLAQQAMQHPGSSADVAARQLLEGVEAGRDSVIVAQDWLVARYTGEDANSHVYEKRLTEADWAAISNDPGMLRIPNRVVAALRHADRAETRRAVAVPLRA